MPVEFRYAARSDVGLIRKNNQDSGYAGPHLMVLADGMGGPAGGDIASSVAVAHLAPLDQDSFNANELMPSLLSALHDAHEELISRSAADIELAGMGTTCIAILRAGKKMAMVHIGDSRAYRLREGVLQQVTTDHSFVQYLVDTGQLSPEEAEHHPKKNMVLRVLCDQDEQIIPDESIREAVAGDRWLLCSDGLSGVVSKDTITEVLTQESDLEVCADRLVQLALRGGGPDNVTVIVFDIVDGSGDYQQTEPQVVGSAAKNRTAGTAATDSASARAAALPKSASGAADSTADEPLSEGDETSPRPRRRLTILLSVLFVLGALAGLAFGVHTWIKSQFYAIAEGDQVVVYQGIPQTLGSLSFSVPVEVTSYRVSELSPVLRSRLMSPVTRGSKEELDKYLESLVNEDLWRRLGDAAQTHTPETNSDSQTPPASTPSDPSKPSNSPEPYEVPRDGQTPGATTFPLKKQLPTIPRPAPPRVPQQQKSDS